MKINWSFPRQIILALAILSGLGLYPLIVYGGAGVLKAAVIGAVLATINVLLGYAAIEYSFGKSTTTFFKFMLGGMAIRMLTIAGILVVLLKVLGFHPVALITSLGIFYVAFMILEVIYIQKKITNKQQS